MALKRRDVILGEETGRTMRTDVIVEPDAFNLDIKDQQGRGRATETSPSSSAVLGRSGADCLDSIIVMCSADCQAAWHKSHCLAMACPLLPCLLLRLL